MSVRTFLLTISMALVAAAGASAAEGSRVISVGLRYGPSAVSSASVQGCGEWRGSHQRRSFDGELRISGGRGEIVAAIGDRRGTVGQWIELTPTGEDQWLELDGSAYRGVLRMELQRDGRLRITNTLPLEEYVRGVVPNEMFADDEAYKVQAVISRTVAVYFRDREKKHRADGFGICATGHCQVYLGMDSERPASDAAVAATRGEVLTYDGKVIFSAYHSNAGGKTEVVDGAWPGSIRENFRYLAAVESPHDVVAADLLGYEWCYQWQRTVTADEIERRLAERGSYVGDVQDLRVREVTEGGRVKELDVIGARRRVRLRRPSEVTALLKTPSAQLSVKRNGHGFDLSGKGHGHGVGLSQHGALGMARVGYTYEEILGHYYTGVAVTEDYGAGRARKLEAPKVQVAAR